MIQSVEVKTETSCEPVGATIENAFDSLKLRTENGDEPVITADLDEAVQVKTENYISLVACQCNTELNRSARISDLIRRTCDPVLLDKEYENSNKSHNEQLVCETLDNNSKMLYQDFDKSEDAYKCQLLDDLKVSCIRLLDVGSCYNGFQRFDEFLSLGIDLCPAVEVR